MNITNPLADFPKIKNEIFSDLIFFITTKLTNYLASEISTLRF